MAELVHHYAGSELSPSEWELNSLFVEEHSFLQKLFPGAVKTQEGHRIVDGKPQHEFLITIGEPLDAIDVFGAGRSLEVGGPSPYGELETVRGSFKPTIVSNIIPGEGVDDIIDAADTGFPAHSFRTVMAIGLPFARYSDNPEPTNLRAKFIKEADRILEPAGHILMGGATKVDLEQLLQLGYGLELGTGCIVSRLSVVETEQVRKYDVPDVAQHMEILLHK